MTDKTLSLTLVLGLSLVAGPLLAAPGGAVLAPAELSGPHRARLLRQIASARRRRPAAFKAVAALRARLPRLAARQRGRLVTVVLPLRSLGRDALLPMLAALAVDGAPRGALSDRAWRGWQISLLEAVGSLRDPRATPVLEAILDDAGRDPAVLRVAARARARRGDDGAVVFLLRLAGDPERRATVLPALGECRRSRVARALATMLRRAGKDDSLARQLVAALGQLGNAWAWKTPAVARSGEGEVTRTVALQALVAAYPALSAGPRAEAVKALALVAHPSTRATIATAKRSAVGRSRDALEELEQKIVRLGLLP